MQIEGNVTDSTGNDATQNENENITSGENNNTIDDFQKLNDITGLSINVQNANGLGIAKQQKSTNRKLKNNSNTPNVSNVLVKSTDEYDEGDTFVNEDGTVDVTFTLTTTTVTTTKFSYEKKLIAFVENPEDIKVKITEFKNNYLVIESDDQHLYRVKDTKDDIVLSEWIKGEIGHTIFNNLDLSGKNKKDIIIEYKSLNAIVTYSAYENVIYSLYDSENNIVVDSIDINDSKNLSKNKEIITIGGLVEGEIYSLKYQGQIEETVVTQSQIGGEIDKLYVYDNRFTFISFVPYGTTNRPADSELRYGSDNIAYYDKSDYYTSNDRVSFVIDNYSGYVYKLENFNIGYIYNNLFVTNDFDYVYDFEIDENNDLKIYALYSNKDIGFVDFGKDIYGNKYISNTKLNYYDENTNTTFFVNVHSNNLIEILTKGEYDAHNWHTDNETYHFICKLLDEERYKFNDLSARDDVYLYTSDKRILHTSSKDWLDGNPKFNSFFYLLGENSKDMEISQNQDFYVECKYGNGNSSGIKVLNNNVYVIQWSQEKFYGQISFYDAIVKYDLDTMQYSIFRNLTVYGSDYYVNHDYFLDYMVILVYDKGDNSLYKDNFFEDGTREKILEDISISEDGMSLIKYGVNGNEYYEVIVEKINGEVKACAYKVGEYVAEPKIIIIQPINR